MKILACLYFLLLSSICVSQVKYSNYNSIDQKVNYINSDRLDTLAKQLARLGATDLEKIRAIFKWITIHIDYNISVYTRNKIPIPLKKEFDPEDTFTTLPSLTERIAAQVLRKRIAVCDGYSRLFKTLCELAGIRCKLIAGYARNSFGKRPTRFGVNHVWNAVLIDGNWYLLDATWASGFVTYTNEYIREYNDFYFLTNPEDFIKDHYPEDIQWTLLENPPSYQEFNNSPFKYSDLPKAGINSYFPAKGVIEANVGDTIKIELKTNRPLNDFCIAEVPRLNSSQSFLPGITKNDELSFVYPVTETTGPWLYIFYEENTILRYKLNIKKETKLASLK